MSASHHNHGWNGEFAQQFAQISENLIKFRYKPFVKEIVSAIKKYGIIGPPTIVDIGTGPGILLFELRKLLENAKLMGVDSSPSMLEIANNKVRELDLKHFEFRSGSAEQIPIDREQIDVVVCLNSLHDFHDAHKTIKEISRILKSGGLFILKDKNGAYAKWKMRLQFIPLVFKTGLKRTLKYFGSNKLWLNPDQVISWMKKDGIELEEVDYKKDYLIIGKKL
ncbi:MAG: class I SAM-dependent methyltransferase [Candidatus Hermodarchaeota archaeon]